MKHIVEHVGDGRHCVGSEAQLNVICFVDVALTICDRGGEVISAENYVEG